jgi:hypothetical protein
MVNVVPAVDETEERTDTNNAPMGSFDSRDVNAPVA